MPAASRVVPRRQDVAAVLEELAGGGVEREHDIVAGLAARRLDRAYQEGERLVGALEVGGEAALVADIGVVAGVLQRLLQAVEDLRADAQAFREGLRAHRHDHEFLNVDRVVGVGPAIDDVHHRHRQDAAPRRPRHSARAAAQLAGRRLGDGEADAEDGVGAEPALVLRAVELAQGAVDADLVERVMALAAPAAISPLTASTAFRTPLPPKRLLVAVAQLHRLARSGRSARGHGGPAVGAALENDVDLDGGISPAVEDFPAANAGDCCHDSTLPSSVDSLSDRSQRLLRKPFDPQEIGGAGNPERQAGRDHDDFAGLGQVLRVRRSRRRRRRSRTPVPSR